MSDGKSSIQEYRNTWNRENLSQVKVSVPKQIAADFRAACKQNQESVAGILTGYMCKYMKTAVKDKPKSLSTRALRAKEMERIIGRLELIYQMETVSLENTPESFQETEQYQKTSEIVDALSDSITQLQDIYN